MKVNIEVELTEREQSMLRNGARLPKGAELPVHLVTIAMLFKDAHTRVSPLSQELSAATISAAITYWRLSCCRPMRMKDGTVQWEQP